MSTPNLSFKIGFWPEIKGGVVEQTKQGLGAYFWHEDLPEQRVLVPQDLGSPGLPEWVSQRNEALQQIARVIIYVESAQSC